MWRFRTNVLIKRILFSISELIAKLEKRAKQDDLPDEDYSIAIAGTWAGDVEEIKSKWALLNDNSDKNNGKL